MKERISITIDQDLLQWVDNQVSAKQFSTRSHALEFLILKKITAEKPHTDFSFTHEEYSDEA